VQREELAVTQGLRCVAVWGGSERRTNVHILPAKTKKEKTGQFNFLSQCNSQTYTTNKTNYRYIHAVFKRLTLHNPSCIVFLASVNVQIKGNDLIYANRHRYFCLFVCSAESILLEQSELSERGYA